MLSAWCLRDFRHVNHLVTVWNKDQVLATNTAGKCLDILLKISSRFEGTDVETLVFRFILSRNHHDPSSSNLNAMFHVL